MKTRVFEGYTTKDIAPTWTVFNTLNLSAVIQKTKSEAMARYDDGYLAKNIIKVKITIEEIKENE